MENETIKITEFPMNQELIPSGLDFGAKVTIDFKVYYLGYGSKSTFHNVTELKAYDHCIGTPGFIVHSENLNGQIFDLSDIESVEISKEKEQYTIDNWHERVL